MNKAELVEAVASKANITKKQAEECLDLAINTIIKSVTKGEKVALVGFGTFQSRERKARKGRNPKTGVELNIPAKKVPAFSAGKQFKQSVNKK